MRDPRRAAGGARAARGAWPYVEAVLAALLSVGAWFALIRWAGAGMYLLPVLAVAALGFVHGLKPAVLAACVTSAGAAALLQVSGDRFPVPLRSEWIRLLLYFLSALLAGAIGSRYRGVRRRASAAAAAVERSNARIEGVLSKLTDGLIVIDAEGRIEQVNPPAAEILHGTVADVTGRSLEELRASARPDEAWKLEAGVRALNERRPCQLEGYCTETHRWFDVRANPVDGGSVTVIRDITARHEMESALRSSESRWRPLEESGLVGTLAFKVSGELVDANPTFLKITGWTPEELRAGQARWDVLTPPGWEERDAQVIEELRRSGSCRPYQREIIRRDGERIWVLFAGLLPPGSDTGTGLLLDVTGLRRAEEALRQSQERLALTVESAGLGTLDLDPQSGKLAWCPTAAAMLGTSEGCDEVDYASFLRAVDPEDRPGVEEAVRAALVPSGSGAVDLEIRAHPPEGLRWLAFRGKTYFREDDGREARRLIGTLLDVTNRKEAEARLRRVLAEAEEGRRLLEALLESIPLGIFIASADGRIVQVSRYGRELIEQRRTDLRELTAEQQPETWRLYHPDGGTPAAVDDMPLTRAARGEFVQDEEWLIVREDGKRIPILCNAAPIFERSGRVSGGVIGWADISALKQAEQALREADRRKDEFLGVLSHELRNPLAPMRTSLYLLRRAGGLSVAGERALAVIERQVDQLARLVDDLLDVTRITRGKIRLQQARLELRELLRRTVEDHEPQFRSRQVALQTRLPDEAVWVDADAARLAQVVGNLLSNSAKFTPAGGRTTLAVGLTGDGRAAIEVADTGVGMDPETLSRLFQPFAQADRSLDRSRGGLGLGLALARGLVELHGGEIRARSEGAGLGASFTVLLPLAAGGFIYIALADLVPALHHRRGGWTALLQLALVFAGAATIWALGGGQE